MKGAFAPLIPKSHRVPQINKVGNYEALAYRPYDQKLTRITTIQSLFIKTKSNKTKVLRFKPCAIDG
jgi:Tfp pilus assembly protein PilO